jgi:hypothetical protein
MILTLRSIGIFLALMFAIENSLLLKGQGHQKGLFIMNDPSPDLPFGLKAAGQDGSGGRILSLAIAPDGKTVYAASQIAGVWKSTDAARSWTQASKGLRNGTAAGHASLAVDAQNPNRLLFATGADDGRENHAFGGLWVSDNEAESWSHVTLGSGDPGIFSVIFASGRPYVAIPCGNVATSCGTWTTADTDLASAHWVKVPWQDASNFNEMADGGDQTLFACANSKVYQITNINSSSVTQKSLTLQAGCSSLTSAPTGGSGALQSAVASFPLVNGNGHEEVAVLDFSNDKITLLGFSSFSSVNGSGLAQVRTHHIASAPATATAAGKAYDVYAADACDWWAYKPGPSGNSSGTWTKLGATSGSAPCSSDLHADTWDIAFAPSYDPPNGHCEAYVSTDGGVYANSGTAKVASGGCISGWVFAESGLHSLNAFTMAGLPTGKFGKGPSLFLPNGDNDVWARYGDNDVWFAPDDGLGDAGQVQVDQIVLTAMVLSRGDIYRLATGVVSTTYGFVDITPKPQNAPCTGSANSNCADTGGTFQSPGTGGVALVMTPPFKVGPLQGDIVAVMKLNGDTATGASTIVRCVATDCTGPGVVWTKISETSPGAFDNGIAKVLASGGHMDGETVIYALTPRTGDASAPHLWRATTTGAFFPVRFTWSSADGSANKQLSKPVNFIVNPYDPKELYAVDMGDSTIKVSFDSGATWSIDQTLTDFATNSQVGTGDGYRFECNASEPSFPYGPYHLGCVLTSVVIDPLNLKLRFASSEFGGIAFSRDSGHHWMALNTTRNVLKSDGNLADRVSSLFYDGGFVTTNGTQVIPRNGPTVYAALHGHSLISVAGPFPTLEQMTLNYPKGTVASVKVSAPSMDIEFALQKNKDGTFSGTLLFDSAKFTAPSFVFEPEGVAPTTLTHTLTPHELETGVATTTCTGCPGTSH